MLSQQFFTRVQLAKILGFKSDGMIKDLEKKGFLTPQIKPSKYTFNQVLFMMICKEIIRFTNLSWKDFIDAKFNNLLKENITDYNLLYLLQHTNNRQPYLLLGKDEKTVKELNDYLDGHLLEAVSRLKGRENTTYEDIPSFHISRNEDYETMLFSIDRIYRKLQNKCTELKINLEEKVTA